MSPEQEIRLLEKVSRSIDDSGVRPAKRRLEAIASDPLVRAETRARAWVARAAVGFVYPESLDDESGRPFVDRALLIHPRSQWALLWLVDDAAAPIPPKPEKILEAVLAFAQAAQADGLCEDADLREWFTFETRKIERIASDAQSSTTIETLRRQIALLSDMLK